MPKHIDLEGKEQQLELIIHTKNGIFTDLHVCRHLSADYRVNQEIDIHLNKDGKTYTHRTIEGDITKDNPGHYKKLTPEQLTKTITELVLQHKESYKLTISDTTEDHSGKNTTYEELCKILEKSEIIIAAIGLKGSRFSTQNTGSNHNLTKTTSDNKRGVE